MQAVKVLAFSLRVPPSEVGRMTPEAALRWLRLGSEWNAEVERLAAKNRKQGS